MWRRWLISFQIFVLYKFTLSLPGNSQNYKISPKPCVINGQEGTCMFVLECLKSEGHHLGMCKDTFMFGSCCAHNVSDNIIQSQTMTNYYNTKPSKPYIYQNNNYNNKYKPNNSEPYDPNASGLTTIHRPHGAGTIVIRPSGAHRPTPTIRTTKQPYTTTTIRTTTSSPPSSSSSMTQVLYPQEDNQNNGIALDSYTNKIPASLNENTVIDLDTASSISTGIWNTYMYTQQWHMTTQPNFITKPKPMQWDKTTTTMTQMLRPKPNRKPTKKPIHFSSTPSSSGITPILVTSSSSSSSSDSSNFSSSSSSSTASKPKPQVYLPKPTESLATNLYTTTSKSPFNTNPININNNINNNNNNDNQNININNNNNTEITGLVTNEIDHPIVQVERKTISAARSAECGLSTTLGRPETRIVGGKNAPFGRWPWQVSVRRTSFFGFSSTHRCGGALINENWITTAGHCVDDLLTSQIRIRVGEYDFSHVQEQLPYVERAVAKKVVHPKYNFFTYEYDLALVKLESQLEFAPHIRPICLPAIDDTLIGENATVTGWGRLSEGGTLPSVLQEVSVPIVSNDLCKKMFLRAGRNEFIPEIFLCAGHETGGHDSCQGDSGGPLQVKSKDGHYFLAGIISWGIGCAEANLPGVCTRISKFTSWILENVN